MFLSSWLESFQKVVRQSSRRRSVRRQRVGQRDQSLAVENLEERCLLIIPPTFTWASPVQVPPAPALPSLLISHASSPSGDPTGLDPFFIPTFTVPAELKQTPGPYASQIILQNLTDPDLFGFGFNFFNVTATSANTQYVQGLDTSNGNSPNLDVHLDSNDDQAYIRFAPGSATFGKTTVTVTIQDLTGDTTTAQIEVLLDDPPSLNPLSNLTVLEDSPPISVPLAGITAGGNADFPLNGGQNRMIYADTTNPYLSGIPLINYNQAAMDQIGTLLFSPVKGQPTTINKLGDNEATITVTIEDAGVDNILGKIYHTDTGKVELIDPNATLDNQIRTQSFRFTIIPVNDPPTINDIPTSSTTLSAISSNTVTVADASRFPDTASPSFEIQIDNERMLVTNVAGNLFTVTRGYDGTAAATHALNTTVTLIDYVVFDEDDPNAPTIVNLSGITPGGGTSVIGNEQQRISIDPLNPLLPVNGGFFTLTFQKDATTHSYTTDLIPYNAPTTTSQDETLNFSDTANSGTLTMSMVDNNGAVTSLDDAITDTPAVQTTFNVDDLAGFPTATGFIIAIDGEQMLVTGILAAPVSGNTSRKQLTVQRGYHGTTITTHPDYASVIEIRDTQLVNPVTTLPNSLLTQDFAGVNQTTGTSPTTLRFANIALPNTPFPAIATDSLAQDAFAGATFLFMNDVSAFPAQGPFRIRVVGAASPVGDEDMIVTSVDTTPGNTGFNLSAPLAIDHFAGDTVLNPFVVRVNREEMLVTSHTNTQMTVVRGYNGTTITSHGNGTSAVFPQVTQIDDLITVEDSAMLSSLLTPQKFIRIGSGASLEELNVTGVFGVGGNQLMVIRGIHGTTLKAHNAADRVGSVQTTQNLNYNASASEIQNALAALTFIGTGNVEVDPNSSPLSIHFKNQLGKRRLDSIVVDGGNLSFNEKQQFQFSATNFSGTGTFTLTFLGGTTAPIPFDATADEIRIALEAIPGNIINPGDVIVGPTPTSTLAGGAITIEFTGQYANQNVGQLQPIPNNFQNFGVNNTLINHERQLIGIGIDPTTGFPTGATPTGGSFQLTFRDPFSLNQATTFQIPYDTTPDNTALNIESALDGIITVQGVPLDVKVTASQTVTNLFTVEYLSIPDANVGNLFAPAANLARTNGNIILPSPPAIQIQVVALEDGNQFLTGSTTQNGRVTSASAVETIAGALSIYDALTTLQTVTIADVRITSTSATPTDPINVAPVLVEFTGQYAGLDVNLIAHNDSPLPLSGLSDFNGQANVTDDINGDGIVDINDRRFDGETQGLTYIAISDNPSIVPNPIPIYSSPESTGQLQFINNTDQFGDANITLTVIDSGFDQDLNTLGDNGVTVKTIHVRVKPTNDLPTITPLPDLSVAKNSSPIPITLKGISAGGSEGQDLKVTATSSNPGLLPAPSIVYVNGATTAQMTLAPIPGAIGSAIITVTVEDAGVDLVLNTTNDNGKRRLTFRFDVSELPTLATTPAVISIPEDSLATLNQPLSLTGITAGGGESQNPNPQPLQLAVSNTNAALFVAPASLNLSTSQFAGVAPVNGFSSTLNFVPSAQLSGNDVFHLTLTDGGPDRLLGTPGQLAANATATATSISVADSSIYLPANPGLPTDKLLANVTATAGTVTLADASAFPATASVNSLNPTTHFKIQIGNEVMTVTSITDGVLPSRTFSVIRGEDGTVAATHKQNDAVVLPFKIRIGNEILRVTGITGNNLNVVRGIDGTTATAHAVQDVVVHPQSFDNLFIPRDISIEVTPVNDKPTLDVISPNPFAPGTLTIPEGSGEQIISLSGVTDGEGVGARQHLKVEASFTDSLAAAINTVNPTSITVSNPDQFPVTGPFNIKIQNSDTLASDINTTAPTSIAVNNPGQFPTSGPFNIRIDNEEMTVSSVAGAIFTISARGVNGTTAVTHTAATATVFSPLQEEMTVSAVAGTTFTVSSRGVNGTTATTHALGATILSPRSDLVGPITVIYIDGNTAGSLRFTPAAGRAGTAIISVTVFDGGADNNLSTLEGDQSDQFTRTLILTVVPVGDVPTINTIPNLTINEDAISTLVAPVDVLASAMSNSALSLVVTNPNRFPGTAPFNVKIQTTDTLAAAIATTAPTSITVSNPSQFPTAGSFSIKVDNEEMTVSAVTGATFTISARGVNGTTATTHALGATIQAPDEELTVSALTGATFTISARGVNGTIAANHAIGAKLSPSNVTSTQTTITLADASLLPKVAPFTVQVDSEQLQVTAVSGNTWTVIRGTGGTIPAAHNFGTLVLPSISVSGISDGDNNVQDLLVTVSTSDSVNTVGVLGTLTSALATGATTLTVTNPTTLPAAPFTIQIEQEQMQVTAVAGNILTVTRGVNATLAVAHNGSLASPINVRAILISNLMLNYNPSNLQPTTGGTPPTTGTLTFMPGVDRFGTATVTVTVTDGGNDTRLGIDKLAMDTTASGVTDVVVTNPTRFPTAVPFNIVIDNEEMQVSSIVGGNTFKILATDRGLNGTTAVLHSVGAIISAPNTVADNVATSRTFTVTVNPVNDAPRVTAPASIPTISEDASPPAISLTNIDAGPFESDSLSITVTSNNTDLIPNLTSNLNVSFTPPTPGVPQSGSAAINYQPVANKSGTATLTMKLMDAGLDGNLGTLSDNAVTIKTFVINVTASNDAPTLNPIALPASTLTNAVISPTVTTITLANASAFPATASPNFAIQIDNEQMTVTGVSGNTFTVLRHANGTTAVTHASGATVTKLVLEDSGENSVSLTGITAGPLESQILKVTPLVLSDSLGPSFPGLLSNVAVDYTSPNSTGTLRFTPTANLFGSATIRVAVEDAGFDGVMGVSGLLAVDVGAASTAITLTSAAGFPTSASPNFKIKIGNEVLTATAIPASALVSLVTVSATSVTLNDASAFPNATPTTAYKIKIGGEVMSVTSKSGNVLTVTRAQDGTVAAAHNPSEAVVALNTFTVTRATDGTTASAHTRGDVVLLQGAAFDNGLFFRDFVVQVKNVDDSPTLAQPSDTSINEDGAGGNTVTVTGISDGDLNSQLIAVTATSSNQTLVPNSGIQVTFVQLPLSPATAALQTATLAFNSLAQEQHGTADITVTVRDAGTDGLLNTADDGLVSKTFKLTIADYNDPPTIDPVTVPSLNEGNGQQTVALANITAGGNGTESSQPLAVSVAAILDAVSLQPTNAITVGANPITFNPANGTGTLTFTPDVNAEGHFIIRLKVEDGGFDNNLSTTTGAGANAVTLLDVPVSIAPSDNDPPPPIKINGVSATNSIAIPVSATPTLQTINLTGITPEPFENFFPIYLAPVTITATSNNQALIQDAKITVNYSSALAGQLPNPSGTLTFTPEANQSGQATITIVVSDGFNAPTLNTLTVYVVNPPTLDPSGSNLIPNPPAVPESTPGTQTVNLTGISAGAGDVLESVVVTATTSAADDPTGLLQSLTISNFNAGLGTADVTYTLTPFKSGTAKVTVTVTDNGPDLTFGDGDDSQITKTFIVTVTPVNDPPTLDPVSVATSTLVNAISASATSITLTSAAAFPATASPNFSIQIDSERMVVTQVSGNVFTVVRPTNGTATTHNSGASVTKLVLEDSGENKVKLTGITAGPNETQTLKVTPLLLSSSVPGLISNVAVDYTSANPTGTLRFTPGANLSGTATIRVAVEDAGFDGVMGTSGFLAADITAADLTVTLISSAGFPSTAPPNFNIKIGNEVMTVTAVSGNTLTVTRSSPVAHTRGDVVLQGASLDNGTFFRDFVPNVLSVNDAPTLNAIANLTINEDGVSTLTANVTSSQTTFSVVDASMFPKSFPFNVQVESEQMQVTGISTNTLTVIRGVGAVAHNLGAIVQPAFMQGLISLTGISAGAGESQTLTVTATSDNQFLIPDANLSIIYTSPNNTATLQFAPLPDKSEDAYITVTVTDDNTLDGTPQSVSRTFRIHVNAVNDAPEIFGLIAAGDTVVTPDGFTATIDENLAVGTEVAVVDFVDDTPLSSLNVSITAGNTGNAFAIGSDGTISVANASAINFEANPTFTLTVKITDNNPVGPSPLTATQVFTINLNDLSEVLKISASNWPASGGLTLKRTIDGKIHVLNSSNVDVVPAHVFANVSAIQVTGRSGAADVLTLDSTNGDPVSAGGLTFDGAASTGDAIKFANATFGQLDTTFASAASVSIDDPVGTIDLTGVEGITFDTTVIATNLKFIYGSGNDNITFADDGISNNGLSTFSASTSPTVTFTAAAGLTIDTGDGNNTVTFNSLEIPSGPAVTVIGGSGNDVLKAQAIGRAVSLSGGDGNDTLLGGSGADTLQGEGDDDVLSGGFGNDQIDGGADTNILSETADTNLFLGLNSMSGLGIDAVLNIQFAVLTGGASGNMISAAGFDGQTTINGAGGNDTLTGSSQDDVLTGGDGNDLIDGGGGDDTLVESGNVNFTLTDTTLIGLGTDSLSNIGSVKLTGGAGNNTLVATGFSGSVTLLGGAGNDILKGGLGDDSLSGDAGNDTLTGGGGTDVLNGGTEIDQVFESGNADFTLTGTVLTAQLSSSLGDSDNLSLVELAKLVGGIDDNTLDASAFAGKTTLQGGDGADTLSGGSNADSLDGGNGNDVLTGGLGNDTFVGGTGNDTISESNVTTLSLTATSMTGRGSDSLTSMEFASVIGTAGNDTISGGTFAGKMTISGLGGKDSLTGGNGADTILGGSGNDTLNGAAGNDFIRGEADSDRILGGTGNDQLDGGDGNDTLSGQAGNDTMLGGDGNDSISGGDDNDAIDGQEGNDKITGDNGNDTLIGGNGTDSINGGAGTDLLFDGDFLSGGNDSDKDTLVGGIGKDTLIGQSGFDVLTDTASEINTAFSFNTTTYNAMFGALLGP